MNLPPNKLNELLEDILPASLESGGPNCAQLLALLRRERSRRHGKRLSLAGAAILLAAWAMIGIPGFQPNSTVSDTAPYPAPTVVQPINDQQLFTLLEDTPAALMEWPDGRRTLLVMER